MPEGKGWLCEPRRGVGPPPSQPLLPGTPPPPCGSVALSSFPFSLRPGLPREARASRRSRAKIYSQALQQGPGLLGTILSPLDLRHWWDREEKLWEKEILTAASYGAKTVCQAPIRCGENSVLTPFYR